MYATFEELIVEEGVPRRLPTPPGSQAGTMSRDMRPLSAMKAFAEEEQQLQQQQQLNQTTVRVISAKPTPLPRKSSPPTSTNAMVRATTKASPPGGSSSTSGYTSDSCSGSCSSINAANPLLDTISALTGDPYYSDSEDGSEINGPIAGGPGQAARVYQQQVRQKRRCRQRPPRRSPNCVGGASGSDGDSIGYAGSNSIDSGYKSFCASACPTPEITTEVAPAAENSRAIATSAVAAVSLRKSAIPIVQQQLKQLAASTVVLQCKGQSSSISTAPSSSSISSLTSAAGNLSGGGMMAQKMAHRLKSQQQDAQLEHLLHLRQSLLTAIQRCESASSANSPQNSRTASPVVSSRSASPASTVIAAQGRVRRMLPVLPVVGGGPQDRSSPQFNKR